MATTGRDIITLALQDAGITGMGLTPSAVDINNGLIRLNDMIDQWSAQRWLVYHAVATDVLMTGATSYTVGPGGAFNIPRPDRLEAARIIQNNPPAPNDVGWPLILVQSMEAYNNIRLQHLGSFPRYVFYDAAFPVGSVYFWPLPSNIYTGRIIVKDVLSSFPNLSTAFNMPPQYKRALRFNLIEELIDAYNLPPKPGNTKRAAGALNAIKDANAQIPILTMPEELVRPGLYNVYSDSSY
jgi:hypothetical protein